MLAEEANILLNKMLKHTVAHKTKRMEVGCYLILPHKHYYSTYVDINMYRALYKT